jgi:hypothetical protein
LVLISKIKYSGANVTIFEILNQKCQNKLKISTAVYAQNNPGTATHEKWRLFSNNSELNIDP